MRTLLASLLLSASIAVPVTLVACSSSSSNDTTSATDAGNDSGSTTVTTDDDAGTAVSRGLALVTSNGCNGSSCHGKDLGGDIQQEAGVYSANITFDMSADMTGINGWTVADLTNALKNGRDDEDADICTSMPKFPQLTTQNISDIYAYLETLSVDRAQKDTDCEGNASDGGS